MFGDKARIIHAEDLYVAVGGSLAGTFNTAGNIYYSNSGETWRNALGTNVTASRLCDVIHADGEFLAIGFDGACLTSPDGKAWTPHDLGTSNALFTVAHNNGHYVALGKNGFAIELTNQNSGWKRRGSGELRDFSKVYYTGDSFEAIALPDTFHPNGIKLKSGDGLTWSKDESPQRDAEIKPVYGNGVHLRLSQADETQIESSHDTTNWTAMTPLAGTHLGLIDLAFGNGIFVALIYNGFLTSADGFHWTLRSDSNRSSLNVLAFANDTFVAVGNESLLSSRDGIHWMSHLTPKHRTLNDVCFAKDTWVIVGSGGTILQSEKVQPVSPRIRDGNFELELFGPSDSSFIIEASSDLLDWYSVFTNRFESGAGFFIDSMATNHSMRFYRTKILP